MKSTQLEGCLVTVHTQLRCPEMRFCVWWIKQICWDPTLDCNWKVWRTWQNSALQITAIWQSWLNCFRLPRRQPDPPGRIAWRHFCLVWQRWSEGARITWHIKRIRTKGQPLAYHGMTTCPGHRLAIVAQRGLGSKYPGESCRFGGLLI